MAGWEGGGRAILRQEMVKEDQSCLRTYSDVILTSLLYDVLLPRLARYPESGLLSATDGYLSSVPDQYPRGKGRTGTCR